MMNPIFCEMLDAKMLFHKANAEKYPQIRINPYLLSQLIGEVDETGFPFCPITMIRDRLYGLRPEYSILNMRVIEDEALTGWRLENAV